MKKTLALILALVMMLSLAACGGSGSGSSSPTDVQDVPSTPDTAADTETEANGDDAGGEITDEAGSDAPAGEITNPDEIDDTMTSDDGTYEIAFITDVGQLKDKSFNQGTFDGVKLYAANNGLSYKYYQPANGDQATDDDRADAMRAAAEAGAKVVVCAGYMQGTALGVAASEFPDVNFVFIDGDAVEDDSGAVLDNVAGIAFQEEQCGYFAGYAIVKEGYTKLGFCGGGGGTNPACCRYGYGFVQGANAAAAEMGVDVEINYSWQYGANFGASSELQSMASGWYTNGTEVIFCAGGTMFQSVTAAASANDALVIGVDVDQSFDSDTVITSALKGITAATTWAVSKAYDGSWSDIGGAQTYLGAAEDATGLPTETWSMETYTVAEYEKQLADVMAGNIQIDNTVLEGDAIASEDFSNVTINYV